MTKPRHMRALMAAIIAVLMGSFLGAPSASANAMTCYNYTTTGRVCHQVYGQGNTITSQVATFGGTLTFSGPTWCAWSLDFVYIDSAGKVWYTDRDPSTHGCDNGGNRHRATGWAKTGLACAYLYADSRRTYVSRACVKITP